MTIEKNFLKSLVSIKKGRTFALAFRKGAQETRSLTDCEQKLQDKQRALHIIILMCWGAQAEVIPFIR